MRIVISLVNYRPGKIGGAETYLKGLLGQLPTVARQEDEVILLGHRANAAQLDFAGTRRVLLPRGDRGIVAARCLEAFTPWRAGFAEKQLAALKPDVVLFPQQSMFPKRVDGPVVLVVLDLQHLFYPQFFSRFDRAFRARIYAHSLVRADRIITISEWTRRTVIERCGIAPEKVVAVQLAYSSRSRPAELPGHTGQPYLYYPAATFPHKGHSTLFRTLAALRGRGDFPYRLVLSGMQTVYWQKLRSQLIALGLTDCVTHHGFVSRDEVFRLYLGAAAVVFPTEFEGFGLPVLEAVQLGKKIVCSRLEVFDEIGLPRAYQIDFADPPQLLAALALPGPTVLERTPWTWSQVAEKFLEVLRQAATGSPASAGRR